MDPLPYHHFDLLLAEVEERFRRARSLGHPAYLWPELPPDRWHAALLAIEDVARQLLPSPGARAVLEVPADVDATAVSVAAFTSGMGPLLGWWLEAGILEADAAAAQVLALHLAHGRARTERVRATLLPAAAALAARDVLAVAVKGAHTAWAVFPEPGTRPLSDVDLLVPTADFPRAGRALEEAGFAPGPLTRRPLKREYRPPGPREHLRSLSLTHAGNPCGLDLHGSLDRNFFGVRTLRFGFPSPEDLAPWPGPDLVAQAEPPSAGGPLETADGHLRVLEEPLLTTFLAAHASEGLHNLTLVRLVELVWVIRRGLASGALRWNRLLERMEALGASRFVYPAFALVDRLAPGTVDADFLAELQPHVPKRMATVLERLTPATAQRLDRLSLAERFMWSRGPLETLRRLAYMAWPASAGDSWDRRGRIYVERGFRVLRRRVSLGSADEPPEQGSRSRPGPGGRAAAASPPLPTAPRRPPCSTGARRSRTGG